jgi:glycosyltransferase involved in cell wall biosynthesis
VKERRKPTHVNFFTEKKGWIIRRLVDELLPLCESHLVFDERSRHLNPWLSKGLNRWGSQKQQIVNYFATYTWFDANYLGNGKNVCLFTHLDKNNDKAQAEWNYAVKNADICVAISEFSRHQIIEAGGSPEKIRLIHYGIDHNVYFPTCNFLIVGKAKERKGSLFLREILESKLLNNRIVFKASNQTWGIPYFETSRIDLATMYQWSDALFVPSLIEGGHTPTLESLASGKPVITGRVGYSFQELQTIIYETGSVGGAISILNDFASNILENRDRQATLTRDFTWDNWREGHKEILSPKVIDRSSE